MEMLMSKNPEELVEESRKKKVYMMMTAAIRDSVSEKLNEFLGDDPQHNVDAIHDLTEYVTVLLCNGKTQDQTKTQLDPFLGETNSHLFVSWLWDLLPQTDLIPNEENSIHDHVSANSEDKKQASKSNVNSSDDCEHVSEDGIKCPNDDGNENLYSDSLEEGELPRTPRSIKQLEQSEIGGGDSLSSNSSKPRGYTGVLPAADDESIQHKKVYTIGSLHCRKLDVANVAGRRLFSRAAADAILHQPARLPVTVWDRLGKVPEDSSYAKVNVDGIEKIEREMFICVGENLEQNRSICTLHDRKFCKRKSEDFDIKAGGSTCVQKRQFSDKNSHLPGVSDSMDEEEAFNYKFERWVPDEDNDVLRENCVSSRARTSKSQKTCHASGFDASTSSRSKKMPEAKLTSEILESPDTAISYSTPLHAKPACKDSSDAAANLNPVQSQLMDMKLRLQQLETEISKIQLKQVEKGRDLSTNSGSSNYCKEGESRTVVVTNVHIAATREALRSYFSVCGAVDRVIKLTDTTGGRQKVTAYVTFTNKNSADKALKLSGTSLFARVLKVRKTGELSPKPVPTGMLPSMTMRNSRWRRSTTMAPTYSGSNSGRTKLMPSR